MAISPFMAAINQICDEKSLSKEIVLETIEAAIAAAYRKDFGKPSQVIKVKLDPETGETKVWQAFEVTEEVENSEAQKTLAEAKKIDKKAKLGNEIQIELEPKTDFGRIAAQTAKQVVLQGIREVEKKMIVSQYQSQIGTTVRGRVIRFDGINVYLDIGRAEGLLPREEQLKNEKYELNSTLLVYIKQITNDKFGNPKIIVSRSDPKLIEELFKREVPEIANGAVEIKKVVRAPGERAKIAVFNNQSAVDPVGACVGQKGIRVQTVTDELGGQEKIDIIQWNKDEKLFLISALSPAQITEVEVDDKNKRAQVYVDETQAPLAIGRGGINVNLASRLTGFDINIVQKPKKEVKPKTEKEVKENPTN